jgi:hypothetical protein
MITVDQLALRGRHVAWKRRQALRAALIGGTPPPERRTAPVFRGAGAETLSETNSIDDDVHKLGERCSPVKPRRRSPLAE